MKLITFKRDSATINRAVVSIGTFAEMPVAMMKMLGAREASAKANLTLVR